MVKNNKILVGVFLFSVLFSIALLSATITINTPTASEAINGTYLFNITTDQNATLNCTWSTTADSNFAITVNTSAEQKEFTNSTDTTSLTEVKDTTLTVTCTNSSNNQQSATRTISIDNTAPTCSFSIGIGEETLSYMDPIGVSPTDASSDTTTLTYLWTVWDSAGNSQDTSTSSTPNFASEDFDEIGEFTLGLTVTDEVGKSTSCTNKTIFVKGNKKAQPSQAIVFITRNKNQMLIGGIVLLLILISGLAIILINKSK